jgi:aminoglycoside phosphotransferase (APT) family kinase protein
MQISVEKYLSVVRQTVREKIIPELKSADAIQAGRVVLNSIEEILKQETITPELLGSALPSGIEIARRFIATVAGAGMAVDVELSERLDDLQRATVAGRGSPQQLRWAYTTLSGIVEAAALPYLKQLMTNPEAREATILEGLATYAQWERDLLLKQLEPLAFTQPEMQVLGDLTADKLQAFLRARLPSEPSLTISAFERLAGGMSSKQLYSFKVERESGAIEQLVARHAPLEPLIDIGCFDLPREYRLVKTLFDAGYPLPEPLWIGRDYLGISGSFYIMRRVEGTGSGGLFSSGAIPTSAMLDMAEQLAKLHSLPLQTFAEFIDEYEDPSLYSCTAADATRRSLVRMISEWGAAARQAAPSEIYLYAWTLANIPATTEPAALLHGDFTPHNCLYKSDRLNSVLDWECAEFGDPAADLAYLRPHIEARMEWGTFMQRYEQVRGKTVDERRLHFFASFFHLRTLICCNIVATRVEQGRSSEIVALNIDYEYLPKVMQICVDATLE